MSLIRPLLLAICFVSMASLGVRAQIQFDLGSDVEAYRRTAALDGLSMGQGINPLALVFKDGFRKQCIKSTALGAIDSLEGAQTDGRFETFNTQKDFADKLNQAFTMDGGISPVSASVSGSLMRDLKFSYSHAYAYIWIRKQFLPKNALDPEVLTPPGSPIASSGDFFKACGSVFVGSYTPGAFAIGTLDCTTTTMEQHDTVVRKLGKLEGSIPVSGRTVSLKSSLSQTLDEIAKITNSECKSSFSIAGGKGTVSSLKDEFLSSMSSYVQDADLHSATILHLMLLPYSLASSTSAQSEIISELESRLKKPSLDVDNYRTRINDRVQYIESIEQFITYSSMTDRSPMQFFQRLADLKGEIRLIEQLITKCSEEPLVPTAGRCGG